MKSFSGWGVLYGVLIWLATAASALASTPVIWEQGSQRDFQSGEPVNISIVSQGLLRLAPALDALFETSEPLVWCLATDSRGNIYAGSGNDGKLFKIEPSGRGAVIFDADELEIHSVAIDASDQVFAATFPDGKIYKLTPDGKSSVFFDPAKTAFRDSVSSDRYIWSLALDSAGNLYAGTGDRGRIYKIGQHGIASVLAETGEAHVVSLAVDPAGNLIAGTDPNGRVYRITPSGKLSVIYDTPNQEIHALLVDSSGTVYAAAIDEPRRVQGRAGQASASPVNTGNAGGPQGGVGVIEVTAPVTGGSPTTTFNQRFSNGGVVYQIRPDGVVREWWSSRDETCFALAFHDDGTLLVGTGPNGIVYAVDNRGQSTTLTRLQESQVTAFVHTRERQITLASSNLGKIYRMGRTPVREGTFLSEIKDTGGASSWGRIGWDGQLPSGTSVRLFTRTGNTDTPDNTWSDWNGPFTQKAGEAITSPGARFIQWKAVLTTQTVDTPVISRVSVAYLTRNVAPMVNRVTVYEPGVYLRDASGGDTATQDLPPKVADQMGGNRDGGRNRQAAGVPTYRKGMRAVAIEAEDPNDDALTYSVYFRGQNESQWKLLVENLSTPSYSWDSETLPDGIYTLRVVTSDAPSNPPHMALTAELESDAFIIDNTAPQVLNLSTEQTNPHLLLTFTVEDAASPIYKVEYAVDGGLWWVIYPDDGVCDSTTEIFSLKLPDLKAGEHTVAIRAKDIANNVGSGKRVVMIAK